MAHVCHIRITIYYILTTFLVKLKLVVKDIRMSQFNVCFIFGLDFDIVTCQLPVSPKFDHGINNDMSAIPEESDSKMDLLSIPPSECASQLTGMDAVSANLLFKKVFYFLNIIVF